MLDKLTEKGKREAIQHIIRKWKHPNWLQRWPYYFSIHRNLGMKFEVHNYHALLPLLFGKRLWVGLDLPNKSHD